MESDCALPEANERASEPEVMAGNVVEDNTKGNARGNGENIVHGQIEPKTFACHCLYSHVINGRESNENLM